MKSDQKMRARALVLYEMLAQRQVSLICTILNEKSSLKKLMESILRQTRVPDEVIIVDGGSSDGSTELIMEYVNRLNVKLYIAHDANIAQGRNIAIRNASYEIIASTDAGCELDKEWLKNIARPFEEDPSVDVVAGVYLPREASGIFERSIAELCYPKVKAVNCEEFLPSSRSVAFKKEAWEKVGGYPEWLQTAEDTVFDLELKKKECKLTLAKDAVAFWGVPKDLRSLLRTFFRYGKGDAEAGRYAMLHFRTNIIKSFVYLSGLFCLALALITSNLLILALLSLSTFFYLYLRAFSKMSNEFLFSRCIFLATVLAVLIDLASIIGFSYGIAKTFRNQHVPLIKRTDPCLSYP